MEGQCDFGLGRKRGVGVVPVVRTVDGEELELGWGTMSIE